MVEITLTSKDEREFKVDAQVAIMSETVKSMLGIDDPSEEIDPPEAAIPLPAVEGNILELVLKYCTYHHENKETKEDEKNAWDAEFVKVDDDTLFSLILAANYLDIKTLLDLTCKTVADYIKQCKTPQEIRRRFNIKNGESLPKQVILPTLLRLLCVRSESILNFRASLTCVLPDFTPEEEEEVRKENAWCEE